MFNLINFPFPTFLYKMFWLSAIMTPHLFIFVSSSWSSSTFLPWPFPASISIKFSSIIFISYSASVVWPFSIPKFSSITSISIISKVASASKILIIPIIRLICTIWPIFVMKPIAVIFCYYNWQLFLNLLRVFFYYGILLAWMALLVYLGKGFSYHWCKFIKLDV